MIFVSEWARRACTQGDDKSTHIMRVPGDVSLPSDRNYTRVHQVNRTMEARCAAAATAAGVAPRVVEYLWDVTSRDVVGVTGVMLTEWVEGKMLSAEAFVSDLEDVGRLLRTFHDTVALGDDVTKRTAPFTALSRARNYLSLVGEFGVSVSSEVQRAFARAQEVRKHTVVCSAHYVPSELGVQAPHS
jgi:hypothetical protein